jgi:hypothetical protein
MDGSVSIDSITPATTLIKQTMFLSLASTDSRAAHAALGDYLICLGAGLKDGRIRMEDEALTADQGAPTAGACRSDGTWSVGIDANFVEVAAA